MDNQNDFVMGEKVKVTYYPLILVIYTLLVASYFLLRFGGHWLEGDTARLLYYAQVVVNEGTILPQGGPIYQQGFGFAAVLAFLNQVSGAPLTQVNLWLTFIATMAIALMALRLYRSLTADSQVSFLSALFLLTQPEFIFSIMRGSHEKITWLLACSAVFLLVKGFWFIGRLRLFGIYVFLFYMFTFSLLTTNVFFASSFIFTVAISFALGNLVLALTRRQVPEVFLLRVKHLQFVALSSCVLLFAFMFYIYTPASVILSVFDSVLEKLAAMFLDVDIVRTSPYSYIAETWSSVKVYLGLTFFSWMFLLLSFVVWILYAKGIVATRGVKGLQLHTFLLWLLYAGFGFQTAASVIADFSGLFGSNFQVRLFPGLMLFAIPLAVAPVYQQVKALGSRQPWAILMKAAIVAAIMWAAGSSVLKATNEPGLSNTWTFYSKGEESAVKWVGESNRFAGLWSDFDNRLGWVFSASYGFGFGGTNRIDASKIDLDTRYVLTSNLNRARLSRFNAPFPIYKDGENRIYDNGTAEVYYIRPRTPYQF